MVVGDRVALAGDTSGAPGTLARVVRVSPRTTALRRSADDTDPVERVIVANADQMGIVCALADPPPRPRFIDRCLVAAYDAGLRPLLCLTKADLASADELLHAYAPLGIGHVVLGRPLDAARLAPLRQYLDGRISVLIGQSGVGKSTLVNALIPDADRAVGTVNTVTGRGRHTSSSAVALRAARRRLDHRHARAARVRARPCRPGPGGARVHRPGPGHGRVPARLRSRPAGLCPGRLGARPGQRPAAGGPARFAAPAAAQPRRRRGVDAQHAAPGSPRGQRRA